MSHTYQRVFTNLGEQCIGHCPRVNRTHLRELTLATFEIAAATLELALDTKAKSLKATNGPRQH